MTVLVAGNITDSVFTASVQPFNRDLRRSERTLGRPAHRGDRRQGPGTIDNSITTAAPPPNTPSTAFYATQVHLNHGPVIPPNVPQPPYSGPKQPVHAPGLHNHLRISQLKGLATLPTPKRVFTGGVATPHGPLGRVNQVQ